MIIIVPHQKEKAENSLKLDKHNLPNLTQEEETQTTIKLTYNNKNSFLTMDATSPRNDTNSRQGAAQFQKQLQFQQTPTMMTSQVKVPRAQIASVNHHNSSHQLWSLGQMFLLFLFILSTSQVTGVPLGNNKNSHIVTADGDLTSSPNLDSLQHHLKPSKRSTGMEHVGRLIQQQDDTEESPPDFPMFQSHGQLFFPSLLKQNELGMDASQDETSSSSNSDESTRPKEFSPDKIQPFDRNRYTSYPSSLRQLNKNEILQTEEDRSGWETVIDPHLYLLTEWNSNGVQQQRKRRNVGPSLSIVNPLDVLRQRLLLEIARRKMRQTHNNQIIANAEILKNIG